jgi:hypothetical protein
MRDRTLRITAIRSVSTSLVIGFLARQGSVDFPVGLYD